MKGEIVRRIDIDDAAKAAMYELFSKQFDGVSFREFDDDLQQKNWVLRLRRSDGMLCGFSSMHLYDAVVDGRDITVVYSGDTVVDPATWSDSALSYYWMGAIDYLRRRYMKHEFYWFLLVSGYRTYRFLPVYSEFYYPRVDRPTPRAVQSIMDNLAHERFGDRYHAGTGIVRLKAPAILKNEFRGIPEHRLSDPHIAFFAERNPGHEQGDELVCCSILSDDKLTPLGRRMWEKGRKLFAGDEEQ